MQSMMPIEWECMNVIPDAVGAIMQKHLGLSERLQQSARWVKELVRWERRTCQRLWGEEGMDQVAADETVR